MAQLKLPPIQEQSAVSQKDRVFRTALSSTDYLKLEKESVIRGLKPFSFTKIIMTNYLLSECVMLDELPESISDQIRQYMKKKRETQNQTN